MKKLSSLSKIIIAILFLVGLTLGAPKAHASFFSSISQEVSNIIANLKSRNSPAPSTTLGAAFAPTGGGTYRLQSSVGTADTSIPLSSFKEPISNTPYTMAYLGSNIEYGTLDPQQPTRSEFISFTGITQNSDGTALLTGVTRGLSRSAPYTNASSTVFAVSHAGQSIFILSDAPGLFNQYAVKANNETITGQWTFSNFPVTASSSFASESAVGGVQLATAAQAAIGSSTGSTGKRLALGANLASSTRTANTSQVVISSSTDGYIDSSYISSSTLSSALASTQTPIVRVYTSTSTWTKPAGLKYLIVEMVGGGGGGSGGTTGHYGGGGGGGAGYSWKLISSSTLSATTSVQILVGQGGAGSSGAASTGGTSFFSTFASSTGGGGGSAGSAGAGGQGFSGDINSYGGGGMAGYIATGGSMSGAGGNSFFGGGGGGQPTAQSAGTAGNNYGGGGGGAVNDSGGSVTLNGGNGGTGVVKVTEYYN